MMPVKVLGKYLSQQQIESFNEQGFLSPIDVMSEAEARQYTQQLEEVERLYPQELNPENRNNPHLVFKLFDELAHHPLVLDAVEDLIGADFSLWGTVLFAKEPHSKHFVSWHQDGTYAGVTPYTYVTPWIALTESNLENGCMSMIPGSHLGDIRPHHETFADDNILTRGQAIVDVDETAAAHLILKPGQMSIHHAQTIHGSQPNRGRQRRVGFAMQGFTPAGARQNIGENYWMPIRGDCAQADFEYLGRPDFDMDPNSVADRARANQNWANILYHGARQKRAY